MAGAEYSPFGRIYWSQSGAKSLEAEEQTAVEEVGCK